MFHAVGNVNDIDILFIVQSVFWIFLMCASSGGNPGGGNYQVGNLSLVALVLNLITWKITTFLVAKKYRLNGRPKS
jgi:hypothetical protein